MMPASTVMDENGGSLTLGGALTIDAGVFEFAGGTLAGVNALTIGTSGVIDAANPNLASRHRYREPRHK